jgi:hypothetical protein
MHWTTYPYEGEHFVALVDEHDVVHRVHPLGFPNDREAGRAAARLNARDNKEVS